MRLKSQGMGEYQIYSKHGPTFFVYLSYSLVILSQQPKTIILSNYLPLFYTCIIILRMGTCLV